MLGLANTISSGSVPESKYSLTFDGTDDFIDLGTGISLGTGDFTISLWVKTDDFHNKFFISEYADSGDNRWYVRGSVADPPTLHMYQEISTTGQTTYVGSSISLDDHQNAWTHLVISADRDGKVVGYVNGVADTADKNGEATSLTTTSTTKIGKYATSTYSDFQMGDVAIWNVALDADAVTAIYNSGRPTNLTFDNGNYDNSSALVAYYKMGNGSFDDKANGVIHDQHGGVELVTNGSFTTDSDWNVNPNWNIDTTGGATCVADGSSTLDINQEIPSHPVANKVYQVSFDVTSVTAGSVLFKFGGVDGADRDSVGTYTEIITASNTNRLRIDSHGVNQFAGSVDNVSVFEISSGYGSNLVVWDGSTTGDWNETQGGNTTLSANSGKLRATADAAGAYGTSRGWTTVVGAVYRVDATIDVDNASGGTGNFRVSENLNLSSQIATLSQSTGVFVSYFTATATTTYIGVIDTAADDTNYMEIEEISVRKLNGFPGLTSGGPTFSSDIP